MSLHHDCPPDQPGPLDLLDAAFAALVAGPEPLSLDGAALGHGLPRRAIGLGELKSMLLHPSTGYSAREAAWAELVARARDAGPAWVVGAAGVALPGLRRVAARLVADYPGVDPVEADAEVLTGFLEALAHLDATTGHLPGRLCWAAYRAGRVACRRETAAAARRAPVVFSAAPPRPWGHPDLVLAEAVAAGVIGSFHAELISATRLGGVYLPALAAELGTDAHSLRRRRQRAEARVVAWLAQRNLEVEVSRLAPKRGLGGCGSTRDGDPAGGSSFAPTHLSKRAIRGGVARRRPAPLPGTGPAQPSTDLRCAP
ncbi:MAG: hypothetical protein ACYCUG_00025 [Acidimicrobiales bacterium]